MNRPFGVPALAGPGRLKAGLRTDRTIQTGSWSPCIRKHERGLSLKVGLRTDGTMEKAKGDPPRFNTSAYKTLERQRTLLSYIRS